MSRTGWVMAGAMGAVIAGGFVGSVIHDAPRTHEQIVVQAATDLQRDLGPAMSTYPADWEWGFVQTDLADALAEGASPNAASKDWERECLVHFGDTTTVICVDGTVEAS